MRGLFLTRNMIAALSAAILLLMGTDSVARNLQNHPWNGARVAIFGDSISDPRTNNGEKKYYWFMHNDIGIIPFVYAENGREWDRVPVQAGRLYKDHGQDFDAIMILMGTNDFNRGIPIGTWFTEDIVQVEAAKGEPRSMQTRRHRTLVFDKNTFCGRINIAMDSLKRAFPGKQIILMTPLHRGLADYGETNVQPDENYTNSCDEYVDAYIAAVKEAGNVWAVNVIDLNAISGLMPLYESQKAYFPIDKDKLHPSTEGHRRLADVLIAALWSIAPRLGNL